MPTQSGGHATRSLQNYITRTPLGAMLSTLSEHGGVFLQSLSHSGMATQSGGHATQPTVVL